MFELSTEIIYNRRIKKEYFEIALSSRKIAKTALPGQFVNIRVSCGLEPLLRRPLSIHKTKEKKQIVVLYEVLGKGTQKLSRKKAGEYLDVIGPLGNGFRTTNREAQTTILVAGGMGTAPLVFLAEKLMEGKRQKAKGKIQVLIGARKKEDILCEEEFRELGCEVKIATDDGSRGFKGYVSELLKQELSAVSCQLSAVSCQLSAIYSCGPTPLLKEISRISLEHNIPAQLSLESHMACGIGACMGCVIKTRDEGRMTKDEFEYKRVCKEGPVFEAREIVW